MAERDSRWAGDGKDGGALVEEIAAIPLVEERVSVSKRQVESGRVRVHVDVEEHEELVTEAVAHDELQIDRVPRNIRLTEVPRVRHEGNTTIVPVVEEVVVVEKVLVLVEEIHVSRRSVSTEAQIPVTLRVEQARVEREPTAETRQAEESQHA
ncbi:MAG TPA: DUF2382 domain-containing protein [Sphingomicrobium sp.]|jgi:uncharacterized protein (TIGR02271 family)